MDMKRISKTEAEKEIKEFFENIGDKSANDIKKIKRLAMSQNIQLKEMRKKFCRKCYSPNLKTNRIKNRVKTIECRGCGNLMKWKMKS